MTRRWRTPRRVAAVAAAAAVLIAGCGGGSPRSADTSTAAQAPPLTAEMVQLTLVAEGFADAVDIAWHGDPAVAYVAVRSGQVFTIGDTTSQGAGAPGPALTALDLGDMVTSEGIEQGLLGLVFHPTQPLAYVTYTRSADGATVLAEYALAPDGTFDVATAREVFVRAQPSISHNGGGLAFGPDGYLYIAAGEGGKTNNTGPPDPERRALDLAVPLGKILRIDPLPAGGRPYTVPADNPFVATDGAVPEIWAYGLRNPWRIGFDPATGDLWIGDVGESTWEEVNVVRATDGGEATRGVSFGWSAWEGPRRLYDDQPADGHVEPAYYYAHGDDGCAVTGGVVYRGSSLPSLVGWYVFGDWCSGKVWAIPATTDAGTDPATVNRIDVGRPGTVSSIRTAPDGEIYVVGSTTGTVHRLVAA